MASMAMARTPTDLTDEALAAAARDGDHEAFASLVDRYRDLAFAYAFARLVDRDDAEDAAQEAFVKAYLALDSFECTRRWGAWIMRVLRNQCADTLRRRRVRRTEQVSAEWAAPGPSPEGLALALERSGELRRAVETLPEKFRIPLVMHYGSGRTYREIALALDMPESTVVGRLAGALRILRRRFREEGL